MQVWQLKNALEGVPDSAELRASDGDPRPGNQFGVYQCLYYPDGNIFQVKYLDRRVE